MMAPCTSCASLGEPDRLGRASAHAHAWLRRASIAISVTRARNDEDRIATTNYKLTIAARVEALRRRPAFREWLYLAGYANSLSQREYPQWAHSRSSISASRRTGAAESGQLAKQHDPQVLRRNHPALTAHRIPRHNVTFATRDGAVAPTNARQYKRVARVADTSATYEITEILTHSCLAEVAIHARRHTKFSGKLVASAHFLPPSAAARSYAQVPASI